MHLPIELWQLIIENCDIDVYKSCILTNKTIYKVINKIISDIPDEMIVKCHETSDKIVCYECNNKYSCDHCKPTNQTNPNELWINLSLFNFPNDNNYIEGDIPEFTIFKLDIFQYTRVNIYDLYDDFPLPTKIILKNKSTIINMKYKTANRGNYWFYYY